ncbi:MAG: DUF1318 domain-containing protein [Verrucomicrobiota bacterium]
MKFAYRGLLLLLYALAVASCEDKPHASYEELKSNIQRQAESVAILKTAQLAAEGIHGYLIPNETVSLEQRHLVQQENVWREQMFGLIAKRSGQTSEQVGTAFAKLATNAASAPHPTP